MKLYTRARDGILYEAYAEYDNGVVTVKEGSKINRTNAPGFKPREKIAALRENDAIFKNEFYLRKDISFTSLSTAATFVTGRSANGNIVWKTENGKYVKYSLGGGGEK